jgi:hypothetical protein
MDLRPSPDPEAERKILSPCWESNPGHRVQSHYGIRMAHFKSPSGFKSETCLIRRLFHSVTNK